MKDVAFILARHCANVRALLDDLEDSQSAQSNLLFAEILRRVRKSAGLPTRAQLAEPKALLALMADSEPEPDS